MKKLLLINFCLLSFVIQAKTVKRIESNYFDKSIVQKVYLSPGLISMVVFPCDIDEVTTGRTEDLKAIISPTSKKIMQLSLQSSASLPTNLIVRCGKSNKLFAFDIVPNTINHQDIIEINSVFGSPGFTGENFKLISSSNEDISANNNNTRHVISKLITPKRLTSSSENQPGKKTKDSGRVIKLSNPKLIESSQSKE